MFVFGLRADAVAKIKSLGYDPRLYVEQNAQLKRVIDAISQGDFSHGDVERYRGLVDNLLERDPYLLMADFADYVATQARSMRCSATALAGPSAHCATSPAWAGSRRTAPSPNTWTASGLWKV